MNTKVAQALIDAELERLQQMSYAELVPRIGNSLAKEVVGANGKSYQIEIEAIWDSSKGGDVRVIVSVDDGGWSAFKPLIGSVIMRPDGHAGL